MQNLHVGLDRDLPSMKSLNTIGSLYLSQIKILFHYIKLNKLKFQFRHPSVVDMVQMEWKPLLVMTVLWSQELVRLLVQIKWYLQHNVEAFKDLWLPRLLQQQQVKLSAVSTFQSSIILSYFSFMIFFVQWTFTWYGMVPNK